MRGDGVTMEDKVAELGDIFWYLARLLDSYDITHQEVLQQNFLKLTDRKNRGVIKGDGDNR
jgi:NTP pyrophosphatase (non-canonical NTP hydrolase)